MAANYNPSKSPNQMVGNKIFIHAPLDSSNCCELLVNLAIMADEMPDGATYEYSTEITNPYDFHTSAPLIDIYIDSYDGSTSCVNSIMTHIAMMRAKGAIIRTWVTGRAAAAASLLAVQGDKGMRIMYEMAYHGMKLTAPRAPISMALTAPVALSQADAWRRDTKYNIYLRNTNLSQQQLDSMTASKDDITRMTADECLNTGLCDWVLMANGKFKGR